MRTFPWAAAAAALSLTALGACGGPASKSAAPATTSTTAAPTPLEMVLASSQTAAASHTMHFAMTIGMAGGSITADGAADAAAPLLTMTMDMGALLPTADRKAGTTMTVIVNDQAMYMQMPGLAADTGGKHWIRLDLASVGADKVFGALAEQVRNANPSQSLDFFNGAKDVTVVGPEDVRGVSTIHYRVTIDLQAAMAKMPDSVRSALAAAAAQLPPTMPGEVWLDGEGLPRRVAYDMSIPTGAAGPTAVHFSMDLFDFGQPVSASIPADGDVIDASALEGGGSRGTRS